MSFVEQISFALERGKSPLPVSAVLSWLASGVALVLCEGSSGMVFRFLPPATAEIVVIFGKWRSEEADRLAEQFGALLWERKVKTLTWEGRAGWPRFLRAFPTVGRG